MWYQPSAVDGGRSGLGGVVIAAHDQVAAGAQLAGLADRYRSRWASAIMTSVCGSGVPSVSARSCSESSSLTWVTQRGAFGGPEHDAEANAEPRFDLAHELGGHRRAA